MKAQLGDIVWLYGRRRVIVRILRCKHGGHCYYGLRMLTQAAWRYADAHHLTNIGFDGGRTLSRIYWIRSDELKLFDGQALRRGKAGRPTLVYRLGRKRADKDKSDEDLPDLLSPD